MEDAKFEDLLLKDNSWNVHEDNSDTLLIETYKAINNWSPPIMNIFLTRKILNRTSKVSNCWNYLKPVLLDMVHKLSALKVA